MKHKTKYFMEGLFGVIVGLLIVAVLAIYINLVENGGANSILTAGFIGYRRLLILAILICPITTIAFIFKEAFFSFIFRYRWLIAIGIFVLCVLFKISGSSIGCLSQAAGGNEDVLFGVSRLIRSDEWCRVTPMALSQVFSDGGAFDYFQDTFRGVPTDMFCIDGSPVIDIAEIFRPFHWGYIFLGAEYGLSFFWCGRFIFLFMISFEFGYRILTNQSRGMSIAFACFIALSGLVQWWFSINFIVEIIAFGQLALVLMQQYLLTASYKTRLACASGIAWSLGIYLLAFYPAWQVSFGYIFLSILISLFITHRKFKKGYKDILIAVGVFIILAILVVYVFFIKSHETIESVLNTAYPGKRSVNGGGGSIIQLFNYPLAILAPIKPDLFAPNVCEAATFFSFAPFSVIFPIFLLIKKDRIKDSLLVCLLAITAFMGIFLFIGFPDIIAKISLLSFSTEIRCIVAMQFGLLMLTFASLKYIRRIEKNQVLLISIISCVSVVSACILTFLSINFGYILFVFIAVIALFFVLPFVYQPVCRKIFVTWCVAFCVLSGGLVNPCCIGLKGYLSSPLVKMLNEVSSDGQKWAVVDEGITFLNVPASLGIKTINSVNSYPQLETWRMIDEDGQYKDEYNRFAYITINLNEEQDARFELANADQIILSLNSEDLSKLGVTNILSRRGDLELYSNKDITIKEIANEDGFYCYSLTEIS